MKKSTLFYLLIIVIITFSACDKDDEVVTQGPAGPQGETGAIGATGTTGVQGNANVHSQTFILTSSDWTASGPYAFQTFVVDSDITQAIVDSGIVNVYYFVKASWTPLPYNEIVTVNSYVFRNWTYFYSINQLKVKVEENIVTPPHPGNTKFKVVTVSATGRIANPHLNWNNYEDVKETFNLKD